MAYSIGGENCNWVTGYMKGDDAFYAYGWNRYLAQTFTLANQTAIYIALAKLKVDTDTRDQYASIYNTDGTGKPTGLPIFETLVRWTWGYMDKEVTWRRATFNGFPILPAGQYALVLSAPTIWAAYKYYWRRDTTTPTYPSGKAWLSHDAGTTWEEIPDSDFMFEIWGWEPPPEPPPDPVISNWTILSKTITFNDDTATIVVTTNIPVHLYMRWTLTEPITHPKTLIRRGLSLPNATRWCFVNFHENEQEEIGDTLIHTFIKPNWPICETRYFYFLGTKQQEEQPSASPIFKHHHAYAPPTQFFFAYEPDKCVVLTDYAWYKVTHVLGGLLKDLLPPEAKVAFLQIVNRGSAQDMGLRPVDSTHNEHGWQNLASHLWAHVALDEDKCFEVFLNDHLNQDVWLMGYATEGAVVMFPDPIDKTPPPSREWQTVDLSAECPDAIAILCETTELATWVYRGIRPYDSTDNRQVTLLHDWPIIGCDSAQRIQIHDYADPDMTGKLYITGYIKKSANFYTNALDKSLAITTSYQTVTIDPGPHLAFIEVYAPLVAKRMAFRAAGSDQDLFYEPNWRHTWAIVPLDAEGKFEAKIEDLLTDFFLSGTGT